uniref:Group 3 late embryogenesis abundant protein n=1 Tax=Chlamydomonas sp. (strain W80) TaxID=103365 RepID=Q6BD01_CHLSW|nr:group 3 late embryogenesis abundant protein [Chlamydomonas sp. W80]
MTDAEKQSSKGIMDKMASGAKAVGEKLAAPFHKDAGPKDQANEPGIVQQTGEKVDAAAKATGANMKAAGDKVGEGFSKASEEVAKDAQVVKEKIAEPFTKKGEEEKAE